jgi:hypothetical protein
MPRLLLSFAVAAGLVLGAVGCSSDEGGSPASTTAPAMETIPPPTHPDTEAGLIDAGTEYFTAGNDGKVPEQYSVMSSRCIEKWPTVAAWSSNVQAATKVLNDLGFQTEGGTVEAVTVSDFTPEKATVNAVVKTVDGKTLDVFATTQWVYEDGGWRVDSCDAVLS